MDAIATLGPLLEGLSQDRVRQLIDFARFLATEDEREQWRQFGQSQFT